MVLSVEAAGGQPGDIYSTGQRLTESTMMGCSSAACKTNALSLSELAITAVSSSVMIQ